MSAIIIYEAVREHARLFHSGFSRFHFAFPARSCPKEIVVLAAIYAKCSESAAHYAAGICRPTRPKRWKLRLERAATAEYAPANPYPAVSSFKGAEK
ncbi:hypothetical protein [Mesorhizobium sp. M0488]|uniref:hypothetical protein n=1 Tax=unclassified Mesorhizobium TaxID=325217 RepID=UPI00333C1887